MRKAFSFRAISAVLLAIVISTTSIISQAQEVSREENCSRAQANFISAMQQFQAAYFEREGAIGSAEIVLEEHVLPSAEHMYQYCPIEDLTGVEPVIDNATAGLKDPNRAQLVICDKALIHYTELLVRFDSSNTLDTNGYRNLLYRDIEPAAEAAIEACPQTPDIAQQTRTAITDRERHIERLEDLEDFEDPDEFDFE